MTISKQYANQGVQIKGVRRLGADAGYVLRAGAVGLLSFVLLAIGLSAGAGLAVVGVGIPILAATLEGARRLAGDERRRAGRVLGRPLPEPRYRRAAPEASLMRRYLTVLSDGQSWSDTVHGLLRGIPGLAGLSLVVTWFAGALAGVTAPLWRPLTPDGVQTIGDLLFAGGGLMPVVTDVAAGILFALTFVPLVHAIAASSAQFSRALLAPVRENQR